MLRHQLIRQSEIEITDPRHVSLAPRTSHLACRTSHTAPRTSRVQSSSMTDPKRPPEEGIEPSAVHMTPTPGAPGEPAPVVIDSKVGVTSLTLTVLTSIAVVVALQYMQAVLVPVVISIPVASGLEPFVAALARLKIKRSVGAGTVLLGLVGIRGLPVYLF